MLPLLPCHKGQPPIPMLLGSIQADYSKSVVSHQCRLAFPQHRPATQLFHRVHAAAVVIDLHQVKVVCQRHHQRVQPVVDSHQRVQPPQVVACVPAQRSTSSTVCSTINSLHVMQVLRSVAWVDVQALVHNMNLRLSRPLPEHHLLKCYLHWQCKHQGLIHLRIGSSYDLAPLEARSNREADELTVAREMTVVDEDVMAGAGARGEMQQTMP
jgi:hypothetical protein